jgi:hypothetical protein
MLAGRYACAVRNAAKYFEDVPAMEHRKHCAARYDFTGTSPSAIVHAVPEFIWE